MAADSDELSYSYINNEEENTEAGRNEKNIGKKIKNILRTVKFKRYMLHHAILRETFLAELEWTELFHQTG